MAFKQIMVASVMVLACLVASASAFVTPISSPAAGFRGPATAAARSTTSGDESAKLPQRLTK